tara:strand:+ start:1164 stop:1388 length:225 start_codon:yes stop_codon:yes gene_type:complete
MTYYHAFYSKKQSDFIFNNRQVYGNIYKSFKDNSHILVTAVYSIIEYPNHKDIDIHFDDCVYKGIVSDWISVYK